MSIKSLFNDKLVHAAGGFFLMVVGILIGRAETGPLTGMALVVLAAGMREHYNLANGGKFDWKDIAATLLGGLVALLVVAVLIRLGF